jgi:O-antigen biosynthesis protein
MKSRFIHFTYPYKHWSAGLRVVHYYCYLMRRCGYDSYVTTEGNPEWVTPIFQGPILDTDIVIYPQLVRGNPLCAKNVVRYMLYFPIEPMRANEYCLVYNDCYYDASVNNYAGRLSRDNILTLGSIEPGLFHDKNVIKSIESVVFMGKGAKNYNAACVPVAAPIITYGWPDSRDKTADLLRSAKGFYTFDRHTALITEALLCGCRVYFVSNGKSPEELTEKDLGCVIDEEKHCRDVSFQAERMIGFFDKGVGI